MKKELKRLILSGYIGFCIAAILYTIYLHRKATASLADYYVETNYSQVRIEFSEWPTNVFIFSDDHNAFMVFSNLPCIRFDNRMVIPLLSLTPIDLHHITNAFKNYIVTNTIYFAVRTNYTKIEHK